MIFKKNIDEKELHIEYDEMGLETYYRDSDNKEWYRNYKYYGEDIGYELHHIENKNEYWINYDGDDNPIYYKDNNEIEIWIDYIIGLPTHFKVNDGFEVWIHYNKECHIEYIEDNLGNKDYDEKTFMNILENNIKLKKFLEKF